jgi:hypothetical protein
MNNTLTLFSLLTSGAFPDLTVTCGSDSHKLHKNVVCSRADFFSRAVKFGGKVRQLCLSLYSPTDFDVGD